jgi:hypothetical protein
MVCTRIVKKSELNGVWGKELSESDEKKRNDERSVPSFPSPNAFDTFGTKSIVNGVRKKKVSTFSYKST